MTDSEYKKLRLAAWDFAAENLGDLTREVVKYKYHDYPEDSKMFALLKLVDSYASSDNPIVAVFIVNRLCMYRAFPGLAFNDPSNPYLEIDKCNGTNWPVCPHCYHIHDGAWEWGLVEDEPEVIKCGYCGEKFKVTLRVIRFFDTE